MHIFRQKVDIAPYTKRVNRSHLIIGGTPYYDDYPTGLSTGTRMTAARPRAERGAFPRRALNIMDVRY